MYTKKGGKKMTYALNVFIRVLACLTQRGTISREKKNRMIASYVEAKNRGDAEACSDLLRELASCTENAVWRRDLGKAIEAVTAG